VCVHLGCDLLFIDLSGASDLRRKQKQRNAAQQTKRSRPKKKKGREMCRVNYNSTGVIWLGK